MPMYARHPIERIERVLQAVEHLAARQKTEIACRHRRKQLQPDVRRRRPRRDDRLRILLEIVGDKPVGVRVDEPIEIPPMTQRVA